MLILFDIGNTNITVGIADLEKIKHVYRLKTQINKTADEYFISLRQMINCSHVKGIIISSVVPEVTAIIAASRAKPTNLLTLFFFFIFIFLSF